ncbi:MAG: CBS domain-containing protein [Oscillochloris sp.]|nr:CBS domain-containing protein [Oscillochloris sp.]
MSVPAIVAPEILPLPVARKLLHEYRIRRLPVVDQSGALVGIVTEGDINRISSSPGSDYDAYNLYYRVADLPLREFMSRPVITVTPDTPLFEAAHLMLTWRIHGLPVAQGNEVVGMISVSDMLRRLLASGNPVSRTVSERKLSARQRSDRA